MIPRELDTSSKILLSFKFSIGLHLIDINRIGYVCLQHILLK